ncbi:STAS/SEC14 domain-containing protein [Agarivorans sp. 1_MG-2023]|uniref:STAS/SEC14 domain-containing protein n=1 Tax=Agarivorans sp. 1_MG-2023 TaxID=3062634 RepID=UPI0026E3D9EF|nr:STAS/SEC14 domain-containing protein [Agarivorans sp. 1_MG-2023]MDO6765171.1 STAS/SEC14 domain-containing protein [Agarivorans sp. 1_MG-2023]
MFTVTRVADNRLDIEFGGKLDSEQMKAALDELSSKAVDIENGLMLYRIEDFALPTLSAIAVELSRIPELFKLIRRFERAAVLCDKQWIQTISELEGKLIPGLSIKAFDMNQVDQAEWWLANP